MPHPPLHSRRRRPSRCARMSCNSPAAMLAAYGVEACRATIVREVSGVFGAYGIGVDPRHLSLIADFMTHLVGGGGGGLGRRRGCSRGLLSGTACDLCGLGTGISNGGKACLPSAAA
jgi:hypothetical protein